MKLFRWIVIACFFASSLSTVAQTAAGGPPVSPATITKPASTLLSDGEVRKVDKDAGKLTIRHGPLTNLDMPAMTMVFRVKDPAILDRVKEGDIVKFTAEKINGAFTVVDLAPAK